MTGGIVLMEMDVNSGVTCWATGALRWYRPPRGTDNDMVLQQMWQCQDGSQEWREVPTEFAD